MRLERGRSAGWRVTVPLITSAAEGGDFYMCNHDESDLRKLGAFLNGAIYELRREAPLRFSDLASHVYWTWVVGTAAEAASGFRGLRFLRARRPRRACGAFYLCWVFSCASLRILPLEEIARLWRARASKI